MQQVRDIGVRISIDDFGTGLAFRRYGRGLRLESSLAVVRAIRVPAHVLGLTCTAEGVATPEQLAILREAGCDLVQGHLFGGAWFAQAIEPLFGSEAA